MSLVGSEAIEAGALVALRAAACDRSYVSMGSRRTTSVHEFYRYPARFSPTFARSAIEAFTNPGDVVLDPFVGGGTSLVEARLSGRLGVGADLNELAVFVAKAKTRIYSASSLAAARAWADDVSEVVSLGRRAPSADLWEEAGYLRHLDAEDTWRIRNAISLALDDIQDLVPAGAAMLARCALLRTGQWALDMRQEVPPVALFREKLFEAVNAMADTAADFAAKARRADAALPSGVDARTVVLSQGVPGLADHPKLRSHSPPRLVLTSPPYPGVYVNYHRWKLRGRKETPAPFWIADCPDGRGMSHYTMSARVDRTLDAYFRNLGAAWRDLVRLVGPQTWIAQMVGFHDPEVDLDRYLDVLSGVGLEEIRFPELATAPDGRLWRDVPGRRWWVVAGERNRRAPHTSREVVLLHRLASATRSQSPRTRSRSSRSSG